ncbi:MAG: hypothetical protein CVU10_08490 [Bacteroidetes bacterium HGW-Bacteroidetes-5]|nr:MAG: hypothetical protein CVU10_08490 [Bacteroidetes bacterium HGW-Bacteroidetes-5]
MIVGKIRKLSSEGIYHVYFRGSSRRVIFYDDEDRKLFCNCINKAAKKFKTKILAYALMDNHIHLLVKTNFLSKFVSSLKISFIRPYYKKYFLTDSLFGSRFGSSVKESTLSIKKCILYILANPLKAGLCADISEYRWISFENGFKDVEVDNTFINFYFDSKENLRDQVKSSLEIKELDIVEKEDVWCKTTFFDLAELLHKILAGRKISLLSKKELFEIKNKLLLESSATYSQIASLLNVSLKFVLYKSARKNHLRDI